MKVGLIFDKQTICELQAGSTYHRYAMFYTLADDGCKEPVGDLGWGAEFRLTNPSNPQEVYAVASVENGKAAWSSPGVLVFSLPQDETAGFQFRQAHFTLDLIQPTDMFDPRGTRVTVDKGLINVTR
jgi:hypothetical protein